MPYEPFSRRLVVVLEEHRDTDNTLYFRSSAALEQRLREPRVVGAVGVSV